MDESAKARSQIPGTATVKGQAYEKQLEQLRRYYWKDRGRKIGILVSKVQKENLK